MSALAVQIGILIEATGPNVYCSSFVFFEVARACFNKIVWIMFDIVDVDWMDAEIHG